MNKFDKKISVVFPAHNEEENIEICILTAHCILKELVDDFEIIVVNDGSTDRTGQICLEVAAGLDKVKVINKKGNEGYGYALRDGFAASRHDLVFFSDSDRQFDITNLKDLLCCIDEYDIVIGFRKKRRDVITRRILSRGYHMLAHAIFRLDVRDIDCAFKLFRKRIFERISIESQYYFVNTEILAKARLYGYRIKEIGVNHFPRYEGESKISFKEIPRTIREIIRVRGLLRGKKTRNSHV